MPQQWQISCSGSGSVAHHRRLSYSWTICVLRIFKNLQKARFSFSCFTSIFTVGHYTCVSFSRVGMPTTRVATRSTLKSSLAHYSCAPAHPLSRFFRPLFRATAHSFTGIPTHPLENLTRTQALTLTHNAHVRSIPYVSQTHTHSQAHA